MFEAEQDAQPDDVLSMEFVVRTAPSTPLQSPMTAAAVDDDTAL